MRARGGAAVFLPDLPLATGELEGSRHGMRHELFASVDDLLAPETLAALAGTPILDVRTAPFKTADSLSGGQFLAVRTNHGDGPRLVLKRFSYDSDWIMRATDDRQGRAVLAWQTGLLDRLPPDITHGYLGCARDGSGWAILLHDLSPFLIPPGETRIKDGDNERFLDAMAALHVAFWEQSERADPSIGFSRLEADYTFLTPRTGHREAGGDDPVPGMLVEGWEILLATVEPVIAEALSTLARDPAPLCEALRAFPQTIVHADWKLGNLGVMRDAPRQVILLDWARMLAGPPAVDLSWYLAVNCTRLPMSKEDTITRYRRCLEARLGRQLDEQQWQAQLELGLLGSFLQLGWSKALGAAHGNTEAVRQRERNEIAWWCERTLSAIDRL